MSEIKKLDEQQEHNQETLEDNCAEKVDSMAPGIEIEMDNRPHPSYVREYLPIEELPF